MSMSSILVRILTTLILKVVRHGERRFPKAMKILMVTAMVPTALVQLLERNMELQRKPI